MEGGISFKNTKTTRITGTIEIISTELTATITLGPIKTTTGTPITTGDVESVSVNLETLLYHVLFVTVKLECSHYCYFEYVRLAII